MTGTESESTNRAVSEAEVRDFYRAAHGVYEQSAADRTDGHYHTGYYETGEESAAEAVRKLTQLLADAVEIGPEDHVLDAGCSVGGPAVWLATNRGAEVTGIDVSELQLSKATERAERADVADRVRFRHDDFRELATVEDDSVDVVWIVEAIRHADDHDAVFEAANRVLRPGGRIVIADPFVTTDELSASETDLIESLADRWRLGSLSHADELADRLDAAGFTDISRRDLTEEVLPTSKRLYWASFVSWPLTKLFELLGRRRPTQTDCVAGFYYQHKTVSSGICSYCVFTATARDDEP